MNTHSIRFPAALLLLVLVPGGALGAQVRAESRSQPDPASPDPDMERPIDALDSVFLEELTWLEVRDALRAGKKTVVIPTGGVEQNGPYLALGKHNYILRATTERIARLLGDALVAPIVPFVPEGDFYPPTGHMRYPGTISVRASTFEAILTDVARSLKTHGFDRLVLLGDSGGNQEGMRRVAEALGREWEDDPVTIRYIPEYYDNPRWRRWLEERGIHEVEDGHHDDVRHSAIMMTVDPLLVRMPQRMEKGLFSINGVDLAPSERTVQLGRELAEYQAMVTVEAIRSTTLR